MTKILSSTSFLKEAVDLLRLAKQQVVKQINSTMTYTYFELGRLIVEEQQKGEDRAEYGKSLLKNLSETLTNEFGKGFSVDNLENMRRFYLTYKNSETLSRKSEYPISETPSRIFRLSWSHYLKLMRIDDEYERKFYEIESEKNSWSVRELNRQYDSALYARLALSRDKNHIKKLSNEGLIPQKPIDIIKDPYILEFIGLSESSTYSENELEQGIINKLEHFLLELGTGFTFAARQKRISFDDKHFYIDLVFYNRLLQCFVLIDLKIGELKHQDLGQMQMYVNYYDREVKLKNENKTIGIVLCQNKSEAVVKYTLPENNEQIFASKYQTILPSKEDLAQLINEIN
ncbi:MAG: DUF1016 domain-containing protein [Flavobacteriales bacterium]|nr:DUF1016 domain-containing protein [Flavobacteriales bacterium]